MNSSLLMAEQD